VGADIVSFLIRSVKTDGLVVEPVNPGLTFLHQLGLETAVPVARHGDRHLAVLPLQPLGRGAIATVGLSCGRVLALLIAQMRGQLGPQHPLHEPDLQLFHQPGIAKQILRPLAALQQLVQ
jgi:hypothetical protein